MKNIIRKYLIINIEKLKEHVKIMKMIKNYNIRNAIIIKYDREYSLN